MIGIDLSKRNALEQRRLRKRGNPALEWREVGKDLRPSEFALYDHIGRHQQLGAGACGVGI